MPIMSDACPACANPLKHREPSSAHETHLPANCSRRTVSRDGGPAGLSCDWVRGREDRGIAGTSAFSCCVRCPPVRLFVGLLGEGGLARSAPAAWPSARSLSEGPPRELRRNDARQRRTPRPQARGPRGCWSPPSDARRRCSTVHDFRLSLSSSYPHNQDGGGGGHRRRRVGPSSALQGLIPTARHAREASPAPRQSPSLHAGCALPSWHGSS